MSNLVEPDLWNYCQTNENPSHLFTTNSQQDFTKNDLWWKGAQFLKENDSSQVHTKFENNHSLTQMFNEEARSCVNLVVS